MGCERCGGQVWPGQCEYESVEGGGGGRRVG